MSVIWLKDSLTPQEMERMRNEFPQFQLVIEEDLDLHPAGKESCSLIEIIYGHSITEEEFANLTELRWIHNPTPQVDSLCIDAVQQKGNILISTTKAQNLEQIGEFTLCYIGAQMKNLFDWKSSQTDMGPEKRLTLLHSMQRISQSRFLQIGLGAIGSEIARRATQVGFRVTGVQELPSFHPYCNKVISQKDLHSTLPSSDIVIVALPRDHPPASIFGKRELQLLKETAILVVIGSGAAIDIPALEQAVKENKFKGVLLDANIPPPSSSLWKAPKVLITPEASHYPLSEKRIGFQTFLHNLRQFIHGNFTEMQNLYEG